MAAALTVICIMLFILVFILFWYESIRSKENEELKKEILSVRSQLNIERSVNKLLKIQINSHEVKYDKDLKDAVFVAMKVSHPDNGGQQEQFVKFRKLYESMKG